MKRHRDVQKEVNLLSVPADVIEKHVIPYLTVNDYRSLLQTRRIAHYCRKMSHRVWKMFIHRNFPSLSAPHPEFLEDGDLANQMTYKFYERHTHRMPSGSYAFFSDDADEVLEAWKSYSPPTSCIVWLLHFRERVVSNFGVSGRSAVTERLIQEYHDKGWLGFEGVLSPINGEIQQSAAIFDLCWNEFAQVLRLEKLERHLVGLTNQRSRLDHEIAAVTAEIAAVTAEIQALSSP